MSTLGGIIDIVTAPLVTAYGEYRKWQLVDRVAEQTRIATGRAIDRAVTHFGPRVDGYISELATYGKLTVICAGSHVISTVAMLPQLTGGCFLLEKPSLSCQAANYMATAASFYSLFSLCVLGGKGMIDAYRYCKRKERPEPRSGEVANEPLEKQKAVIKASIELERARWKDLSRQYKKLEDNPPGFNLCEFASDFASAIIRDPLLLDSSTCDIQEGSSYDQYLEDKSALLGQMCLVKQKIEALENQLL